MDKILLATHGLAAVLLLGLTVLALSAWRGRLQGALFVVASVTTALWALTQGISAVYAEDILVTGARLLEVLRDAVWIGFLIGALGYTKRRPGGRVDPIRLTAGLALAVALTLAFWTLAVPLRMWEGEYHQRAMQVTVVGHLVLVSIGLLLVEQLYRNTRPELRTRIKFLCLALGGLFAYDLYLYSDAFLYERMDHVLWAARGAVTAVLVPLLAAAVVRNPEWSVRLFVSRHIVLHTVTTVGAGLYLVFMVVSGYYIRLHGGDWGPVLQTSFLFGAGLVLAVLLFSEQLRATARVLISKHFFRSQYDYREQWLRLSTVLSETLGKPDFNEQLVKAIADMVASPGGVLWRRQAGTADLSPAFQNALPDMTGTREAPEGTLARFLETTGWVIDVQEFREDPEMYQGLELPPWLTDSRLAWLVVPLLQKDHLLGFVVLSRSRAKRRVNWEDIDLLKTVGRQAASYIAVLELTEALGEARQFEAFNRLSAFVVHDLKNLIAQLSLVVSNARRHIDNPEFVKDAIETVESAVNKMNRLMVQLRRDRMDMAQAEVIEPEGVLQQVVGSRSLEQPVPKLECTDETLKILANRERFASVMEHLIQNAQEATPPDGRVLVRLLRDGDSVLIEVQDTGCGMAPEFIRDRLFRPFDTTKGNAGMGVGVYESREFVRAHGGSMDVFSEVGAGTTLRIRLPFQVSTLERARVSAAGAMR